MIADTVTYCANHPDRVATLRCNRCDKPICLKCAVRTPTGYRCRECVNQQQQIFETALWYDPLVAFAVAFAASAIIGAFVTILSYFVIFVAPVVGGVLARVVLFAVRKRRSKYLPWIAAGGTALGGLALCAVPFAITLLSALLAGLNPEILAEAGPGPLLLSGLVGGLWPLVYSGLAATTVFYSLRGIRIN